MVEAQHNQLFHTSISGLWGFIILISLKPQFEGSVDSLNRGLLFLFMRNVTRILYFNVKSPIQNIIRVPTQKLITMNENLRLVMSALQ